MNDDDEIKALIAAHFDALRWGGGTEPDWQRFSEDFLPEAILVGAARPVTVRSVDGFIDRMETAARTALETFEEHTGGMKILRFGNVAVVLASSELLENGSDRSVDLSGYLLVKDKGRWAIAAHAWDQAGQDFQRPDDWIDA